MCKPFPPAYVFLYTELTTGSFRVAQQNPGSGYAIDVQNSAPPFDCKCVQAWASKSGEKLCFENGSASAVVAIIYDDVLAHMEKATAAQDSLLNQIQLPSIPQRKIQTIS